jgi:hypothetical protein
MGCGVTSKGMPWLDGEEGQEAGGRSGGGRVRVVVTGGMS